MDTRFLDRLKEAPRNAERGTRSAEQNASSLRAPSSAFRVPGEVFHWEGLTLVIRGYLRPGGTTELPDRERLAGELRWRYLEQGLLDLSELEGSATVALFDAHSGEVQAARTHGSPFPLYYRSESDPEGRHAGVQGVLSGNLAELASRVREPLSPDRQASHAWIDQGELPDRQTLFDGVFRLLPGERILFDEKGLRRFAVPPCQAGRLTLAKLDAVMRDCIGLLDRPAAVLAGRWASVCLQVLRNRHLREDELMPTSVSLAVDEPRAWNETDWVMAVAQRLGTGHLLVPAEQPAAALVETLAATAEPPAADLDLFLSPFAAELQRRGLRSVLLDGGSFLGQEATHDQRMVRRFEHALICLERAKVEALCPFFDSRLSAAGELARILKPLLPILPPPPRPAALLTAWLRPGQPLAHLAEQARTHDLMTTRELDRARLRPTDRLARLVCYDQWHRLFLENDVATPDRVSHADLPFPGSQGVASALAVAERQGNATALPEGV